jgi:hypothetical protein
MIVFSPAMGITAKATKSKDFLATFSSAELIDSGTRADAGSGTAYALYRSPQRSLLRSTSKKVRLGDLTSATVLPERLTPTVSPRLRGCPS